MSRLVKAIESQSDGALMRVDGHVAVKEEAFNAVPQTYSVSVKKAQVTDANDPAAKEIDVFVVTVSDAKPKPTLVVANGMV